LQEFIRYAISVGSLALLVELLKDGRHGDQRLLLAIDRHSQNWDARTAGAGGFDRLLRFLYRVARTVHTLARDLLTSPVDPSGRQ